MEVVYGVFETIGLCTGVAEAREVEGSYGDGPLAFGWAKGDQVVAKISRDHVKEGDIGIVTGPSLSGNAYANEHSHREVICAFGEVTLALDAEKDISEVPPKTLWERVLTLSGLYFSLVLINDVIDWGLDYALVGKLADRGHPRYAALLAATTTVSIVLLVFGKLLVAFTHKPGPSRKSGYKLAWFCLFELSVFAMEDCTTIFIFTQVDIYDAESFVDRANIWTSCTSGGLTIVALFAAVFLYTASGLGELAKTDAAEQQDKRIHCGETLLAMFCCGAADVDGGGQGVHRGVMASGFVGKLAATIGEWCQTHGAFYSLITYLPLGPPTAMLVFFLYLAGVVYLREEFAPLDPKSLDSSAIAIYIIFLIFAVGGTLFIFFWVFVDWGGPNGIVFTLREKLASKLFRNPEWYEDAVKRWSDDRASRTAEGVEHGGKWYIHIYTPSLRGLSAGRAGASLATLSRQAENWKMVIFEDKGGGKVKVKDDSGKYLVAKDETAVRWAFHPAEEDWATFTFTPVRGSQFTLQSCHDKYLACVPSSTEDKAGGNVIAANSNGPWAQETFTRIPWRKSHGSPHLMTADPLTEKLLGQ